jgi:hypothetical protein
MPSLAQREGGGGRHPVVGAEYDSMHKKLIFSNIFPVSIGNVHIVSVFNSSVASKSVNFFIKDLLFFTCWMYLLKTSRVITYFCNPRLSMLQYNSYG